MEELTKKVKDAHTFLRQANTLRYSGQKFTQQMEAEVSKKYYEAITNQEGQRFHFARRAFDHQQL